MRFPSDFLDEIKARIPLSSVVGRSVTWSSKSKPAAGDYWACCPFHNEKTPSFHVDDRKGVYYCFGCHAKGEIFTYLQETMHLSFPEAVETLAREANLQLPERDPVASEKDKKRSRLRQIVDQAAQIFARNLTQQAGQKARSYLLDRGVTQQSLADFRIGYARDDWESLTHELLESGFSEEEIVEAGLAGLRKTGAGLYDRFRDRIIFTILDNAGRPVAFGGRAIKNTEPAKYLNSPETPIFSKGSILFNFHRARSERQGDTPLIVVEGYLDVIALAQAGLPAVAPLGTAMTDSQLNAIWRIYPEPVIAFDGDKAGQASMMRIVDMALPMIAPERSLSFCLLSDGMDPDDYLRSYGRVGLLTRLDSAVPLVEFLWQRETSRFGGAKPERRAALQNALNAAADKIADRNVRKQYYQVLKEKLWKHFKIPNLFQAS